jgi:hypothetical protein
MLLDSTIKETNMPLLEINQTCYISASVRLDESTAEQIGTPLSSTHPPTVLWKQRSIDRDFQGFLKTPHARQVVPTLRVRRGPTKDAKHDAEQPAKKQSAGVESTSSVRAVKP